MNKRSIAGYFKTSWLWWTIGLLVLTITAITFPVWWPAADRWLDDAIASHRESVETDHGSHEHDHDEHDHHHDGDSAHTGHTMSDSLDLSPQAMKNLGLTPEFLKPITLTDYYRTITLPAIIVAKPGRTDIVVSSPMIGIVQHVHAVSGEAVSPGDRLFEVRLTYEDLVDTQTQLLKNLADLEIEQREVLRLEDVTRSGAVASKLLLERQYAMQKLESSIDAQRAALKLHGLNDQQVDTIIEERRLLRDLTIVAPSTDDHQHNQQQLRLSGLFLQPASFTGEDLPLGNNRQQTLPLIVDRLNATKGQGVQAGEMLCSLSDYSSLYIEGRAFEQDAPAIADLADKDWSVEAIFANVSEHESVAGLKLTFVSNAIDPQSRTLSFFVNLPNTILRDVKTDNDQRFITWKYRIGQRLELRVPIEMWQQQIVLPVDAAVKEGADWFVFQQNGKHFDRVAVHVKHRDQRFVVIENDGAIFPGDIVALRSAHQMQMALKNRSGAGVDPHAGHSH